VATQRRRPQHIEIVHFAEQVLHVLQVVAPEFVLDGQKILDDVTEAFDADAQRVQRDLRPVAHGPDMQIAGSRPALQRQMLEDRTARPDVRGAQRQRLAPLAPLFTVEFFESCLRLVLLHSFAVLQNFKQRLHCRIWLVRIMALALDFARYSVCDRRRTLLRVRHSSDDSRSRTGGDRSQLFQPPHHDLNVTQFAQPLKQPLAGLFHRLPVRVRINRDQSVSHRTAAAQRDP
jgi:hypothetical protein